MQQFGNKKDIIFDTLKGKILSGKYPSGYKFPNEPILAGDLGVGRITLRSALERLEQEGLLVRLPGKGTFVNTSKEPRSNEKKILILLDDKAGRLECPTNYIVPAFEKTCRRLNITTESLEVAFLRVGEQNEIAEKLRAGNYYAVLLNGNYYNGSEKELKILRELKIPVLIPHGQAEDYSITGFAVMYCDIKQSFADGIRHLARKGHIRFATLGILAGNGEKNLRGFSDEEYFKLLDELNVDSDPELLKYAKFSSKAIDAAVRELMAVPEPPSAIMCFSDFVALEVYKTLNNLEYQIPNDVAVMGYCGYPGDKLLSPSLATVDLQ
jgi:hypothetical protein